MNCEPPHKKRNRVRDFSSASDGPLKTPAMDHRQEVEVNVVSSPESSRIGTPEPDAFHAPAMTCFPVIKTGDDEKGDGKGAATQKTSSGSTNFSISSILSRTEPTGKKNGLLGLQGANQNGVLDVGIGGSGDSAMLSR